MGLMPRQITTRVLERKPKILLEAAQWADDYWDQAIPNKTKDRPRQERSRAENGGHREYSPRIEHSRKESGWYRDRSPNRSGAKQYGYAAQKQSSDKMSASKGSRKEKSKKVNVLYVNKKVIIMWIIPNSRAWSRLTLLGQFH